MNSCPEWLLNFSTCLSTGNGAEVSNGSKRVSTTQSQIRLSTNDDPVFRHRSEEQGLKHPATARLSMVFFQRRPDGFLLCFRQVFNAQPSHGATP